MWPNGLQAASCGGTSRPAPHSVLTHLVHRDGNFCVLDSYKRGGCPQVPPERLCNTLSAEAGVLPYQHTSGNLLVNSLFLCTLLMVLG